MMNEQLNERFDINSNKSLLKFIWLCLVFGEIWWLV
jgi:hypothetical protein